MHRNLTLPALLLALGSLLAQSLTPISTPARTLAGGASAELSAQQPGAITYRYDELNRLSEVISADGTRITYTYDATGNLTRTVTGKI
jgi:YD repeat-containing protein